MHSGSARNSSAAKEPSRAAQERRRAACRERTKATVAMGHSILARADQIVSTLTPYATLGRTSGAEREHASVAQRLSRRRDKRGLMGSGEPLRPATDVA